MNVSHSYRASLAERLKSILAKYPTSGELTIIGTREDWYEVVEALTEDRTTATPLHPQEKP